MAWKVTTLPATEIFTLQEVKDYLKVDDSTEDTLISTLLQSARQAAESYLNQALITQTITEKYDRLSNPTIYLSVSPVIAVSSFQYKDGVNSTQTYDAANYVVDTFIKPGKISFSIRLNMAYTCTVILMMLPLPIQLDIAQSHLEYLHK
jgi:uncharacterized phiE125 gp8 family phage protein